MAAYRISLTTAAGAFMVLESFEAGTADAARRRHQAALRDLRPQLIWTHEVGGKGRVIAGPDSHGDRS